MRWLNPCLADAQRRGIGGTANSVVTERHSTAAISGMLTGGVEVEPKQVGTSRGLVVPVAVSEP